MGQLKIPYNGKLIEGHPIGIDKIILGDLREKEWAVDNETYTNKYTDGIILYNRTGKKQRPWFILVYESG
jgi:hypothetical protein